MNRLPVTTAAGIATLVATVALGVGASAAPAPAGVGGSVAAPGAVAAPAARPAVWAAPVALEGVPNLHKVSDQLYRSAQPTAEGMARLRGLGVRTVVNLRSFHSDRDELAGSGLAGEQIWMKAWHPEEKEAVQFLRIVTATNRAPVLVHCLHGADRTGTMCALYRVAVQGWPKEEALREMVEGGFNFHGVFQNLLDWVRGLDMERIRREAGVPPPPATNERPAKP